MEDRKVWLGTIAVVAAALVQGPPLVADGDAEGDGGALETAAWPAAGEPAPTGIEAIRHFKQQKTAEQRARSAATRFAKSGDKTVAVDCTKGSSIQQAIDGYKGSGRLVVDVEGICHENVRIERKRVTLRGLDPATDGIQGVAGDAIAALEIYYVDGARIESLSISDGPEVGVGIWFSHAEMESCRLEGNGSTGLHVSSGSFLFALGLTVSENGSSGITSQRGSLVFCDACYVEDNAAWAGRALRGGLLTLRDSIVSGVRGLLAVADSGQAYVDVDCLSAGTGHPCSLSATRAASAFGSGATASLYGAGAFSGSLLAMDQSTVSVFSSQQTTAGVGGPNVVDGFSRLIVGPEGFLSTDESELKGDTIVSKFGRALLNGATVIDGDLTCDSAGDAWADPGVAVSGAVTGCDHAP